MATTQTTLRGDARAAGQRRRQEPLRAADEDHRAGVRPDETQPPRRSIPTKRPGRLPGRMETDHRNAQLAQALATEATDRYRIARRSPIDGLNLPSSKS